MIFRQRTITFHCHRMRSGHINFCYHHCFSTFITKILWGIPKKKYLSRLCAIRDLGRLLGCNLLFLIWCDAKVFYTLQKLVRIVWQVVSLRSNYVFMAHFTEVCMHLWAMLLCGIFLLPVSFLSYLLQMGQMGQV